jgi:hypothetical protein
LMQQLLQFFLPTRWNGMEIWKETTFLELVAVTG